VFSFDLHLYGILKAILIRNIQDREKTSFVSNKRTNKWAEAKYHIFFWLILFVVMLVGSLSDMSLSLALSVDIVNVLFFALIVYFNYFLLFPDYLKNRNFTKHLFLLGLASLLLTPVKTIFLYQASFGNKEMQEYYLENQLYIFISTYFVGSAATIYRVMSEWIIQQQEKKDLESQTLQSELNFLKSQINPHFLFNTLNSLYALTLKKSDLAPEIVLKLSEMMRYMLYDCNEKEVSIEKEINYIKNYLELEKLRHGRNIDIKLKIEDTIGTIHIAPLLLIPFIENAFKHGTSHLIPHTYVDVELSQKNNQIEMRVNNSKGPSVPTNEIRKNGGIGLLNVRRRLDILYPDNHTLKITETPNEYRVELTISIQ
jgi:two-component system LytT family sensor kinase